MKRRYRNLLILLGTLLVVLLVVVANYRRAHSTVQGIEVHLRYGNAPKLVSGQMVHDSILAAMPALLQQQVRDVDCRQVVEAATRVPYLYGVTAAVSVSGKVVVRGRQRRPVARLFHGPQEWYFDRERRLMPASPTGGCNVLVAGGDFDGPLRPDSLDSRVDDLMTLAIFLDREKRYGELIDQIYAERDGDVMMVPKLGGHVVELGAVEDLDEKFSNLLTFYRKGMPRAGWDTYSSLSLKFKGQVVCTKRK